MEERLQNKINLECDQNSTHSFWSHLLMIPELNSVATQYYIK